MARPGDMRKAADDLVARHPNMSAAEFVTACAEFIRDYNTLPRPLSGMRRAALQTLRSEAVADDRKIRSAAKRVGIADNRFYRLAKPATEVA